LPHIRRTTCMFIAAVFMLALAGCGKDAVKPSAENLMANKALGILADMKKAYDARDMYGVLNNVSPALAGGYAEFSGRVRKDTETFPKADLDLTIDRVEVDGTKASVVFHWFGKWTDAAGKTTEGRGNSVFTFQDAEKMTLVSITGDSPFGIVR